MSYDPDEMLDVVDPENRVVGQSTKKNAHTKGLLHRIAIGELVNKKGERCFVRQAGDRQDAGQFVSPIGGHVKAEETVEAALIREGEEEVGVTPKKFHYVGATVLDREVLGRRENHLFLVYEVECDEEPVLNHESVEYRWFSIPEIKKILATNPDFFGAAWHHVFRDLFPEIYC